MKIYKYIYPKIIEETITLSTKDSVEDVLENSDPRAFAANMLTEYPNDASTLLDDVITRQGFIEEYLTFKYPLDMNIINNPMFVIDFDVDVNLPDCILDRVPEGKEYLVRPELIYKKVMKKYFPQDDNEYDNYTKTIIYNICKYSNYKYTTLREFLERTTLIPYIPQTKGNKVAMNMITVSYFNSNKSMGYIRINLHPLLRANGMTINELREHLKKFTIERAILDCMNDMRTLIPIANLILSGHTDLYMFALSNIPDLSKARREYKDTLLTMMYTRGLKYPKVVTDKASQLLLDLLETASNIGREPCVYVLYKILSKKFPNNQVYENKYQKVRLSIVNKETNWCLPFRDLYINNDRHLTLQVIKDLIMSDDPITCNSLEEYANK